MKLLNIILAASILAAPAVDAKKKKSPEPLPEPEQAPAQQHIATESTPAVEPSLTPERPAGYLTPVIIPDVPDSIRFAAQTYHFDRIDLYERLDRELTAMSYTHGQTSRMLKYANRYFPEIMPILRKNGMPDDIIYLACIESSMDPTAYSRAGAAGIWQFMPATGKDYGLEVNDYVDERYNIEKATEAACRMLTQLHKKFGNWEAAAASYNAGAGRISSELASQKQNSFFDINIVDETSRYVFRILAAKLIMENPDKYGFVIRPDQFYTPVEYDIVEVSQSVADWPTWAKQHGLTYAQLLEHNRWIRAKSLPNSSRKTYKVRIPKKESLYRSTASHTLYNPAWATAPAALLVHPIAPSTPSTPKN